MRKKQTNRNTLKLLSLIFIAFLLSNPISAQRKMESLDRGLVAVGISPGVYLSWRLLGDELRGVSFNIYRDGVQINTNPISGATNFVDESGTTSSTYTVSAIVDANEQSQSASASVWENQYLDIPVREIDGSFDTYELNDASVGDLDGDGEYEIVVKRLSLGNDLTTTNHHYLEAYEMDGTFMWAINLGPNIRNKVEVNFLVYDFDEDGKAEIATRTSDGMIDGIGNNIGDRDGDGVTDYRYSLKLNSSYYRTEGPDYISIFNGETGEEITWDNYIDIDPLSQWGVAGNNPAQLAHRAVKCMWTVAYLDGKHPSIVNGRGIYHRIKLEAWDFDGTDLNKRWSFDSDPNSVGTSYTGQGNHNLSLADVDMDGKDEVVYGSMVVDDDGTGLYSTQLGHGDALHITDMDPDRPGLEIWECLEETAGATFRDAETGEILIQYFANRDCGRAAAGDITAEYKGYELWAALECPLYSCNGQKIGTNSIPQNFMIWWDGDLLREFLNHNWLGDIVGTGIGTISKYNNNGTTSNLLTANGTYSNNWSKGTPCVQADILGDWREEVIWRSTDNSFIRLYTTQTPTNERIPTLMHDPQYRIAVTWQNNSYNQPPHVGFYLGAEMVDMVPYPISNNKTTWNSGANWDINTSSNWIDDEENSITFQNGQDVQFDVIGDNSSPINLIGDIAPRSLTYTSPTNYTIGGTGKLTGNMELLKAGTGTLTLNNTLNDYTGKTMVYYGNLIVDGHLNNSSVEVCMFGSLFANGNFGKGILVKTDGKMQIGNSLNTAGIANISPELTLQDEATIYFDLSDDTSGTIKANDYIEVDGDLTLEGKCTFFIDLLNDTLQPGEYTLIKYNGNYIGNLEDITIKNIEGTAFELFETDTSICLRIHKVRKKTTITWKGDKSNIWDLALTYNWLSNADSVLFLNNDTAYFDNTGASQATVELSETLSPALTYLNASTNYTFQGSGRISGTGGLLKEGTGKLTINNTNTYTGSTTISKGVLEVSQIYNAGISGPLGAANNTGDNIVFDGGELSVTNTFSATNRNIFVNENGGTLNILGPKELSFNGIISGSGSFTKSGYGKLILNTKNTFTGGFILENGELNLGTLNSMMYGAGEGPITILSGTLSMAEGNATEFACYCDIVVPKLRTASIDLNKNCKYTGSLSGEGTIALDIPGDLTKLLGDWSEFKGVINIDTDEDGGRLLLGNENGYAGTTFNLDDNIALMYYSDTQKDGIIEIGELTGSANTILGSGGTKAITRTWALGGKNTSFAFDGLINEQQLDDNTLASTAIIKTGGGSLTLTNSNTYTGGTDVEMGQLIVANSEGSATGTGSVHITSNATLSGNGFIEGPVTNEGYIAPGIQGMSKLTIKNSMEFVSGSYFAIDLNTDTDESDTLEIQQSATLNGIMIITNFGSEEFQIGDQFKILNISSSCSGNFRTVYPKTPGTGMKWNLTTLCSDGTLKVADINEDLPSGFGDNIRDLFNIFPNPSEGMFHLQLNSLPETLSVEIKSVSGGLIFKKSYTNPGQHVSINLTDVEPGIYFLNASFDNQQVAQKIVIE